MYNVASTLANEMGAENWARDTRGGDRTVSH